MAVPRAWLPVDCDDVSVPEGLGAGDRLPQAAEYVRDNKLPPEFAGVECVVTATSSSGMKGSRVARLSSSSSSTRPTTFPNSGAGRLPPRQPGCRSTRPCCRPGQPIYTARPRFEGIDDPVPEEQRAFVLPGVFGDRVSLVVGRYDRKAGDIVRRVGRAEANCGGDWRALLDQTLGGETGFHEPLKRGIGRAARSTATEQEIVDFVVVLLAAARRTGAAVALQSELDPQGRQEFPPPRCPHRRRNRHSQRSTYPQALGSFPPWLKHPIYVHDLLEAAAALGLTNADVAARLGVDPEVFNRSGGGGKKRQNLDHLSTSPPRPTRPQHGCSKRPVLPMAQTTMMSPIEPHRARQARHTKTLAAERPHGSSNRQPADKPRSQGRGNGFDAAGFASAVAEGSRSEQRCRSRHRRYS